MPAAARRSNPRSRSRPVRATTYWDATREPLCNFVFLLPIIAAYEFGALLLKLTTWSQVELVAERLVRNLLGWFGAGGMWVPGLAVLLSLAAWHVLSRRPWQLRAWIPLVMVVECAVVALPLYALGALRLQGLDPLADPATALAEQLVLAVGAGIYEEALFRLALVSFLLWVAIDLLRMPRGVASVLTIAVGGTLFSLCHYAPLGAEAFAWETFVQRSLAGGYLSLLFVYRGIGVATGCHALYNVSLVLWHATAP